MLGTQERLYPSPTKLEVPEALIGQKGCRAFPAASHSASIPTHSPEPKAGQMGPWREEAEGGGRLEGGSDLTPAGATS